MITKNTLVQVTILVPISDIEIIDPKVSRATETRHHPGSWDITYGGIAIKGIGYEILDYEDVILDEKLKQDHYRGEL